MRKIAFVFPGQGSQQLGMLSDISQKYPFITNIFSRASEVLGYDLWALIYQGPKERLDQTEFTQPALLVAEIALWELFKQQAVLKPMLLAGHSLGEYTALYCAGVLDFVDVVDLVATRARLMQAAVPVGVGAMGAIIGLPDEKVYALCQQITGQGKVSPANYNCVGQVVIAGHRTAVIAVLELAKEQGAKLAQLIPVSVPAHSELMRPAAEQLAEKISQIQFKTASIPVVHNVDASVRHSQAAIAAALIEQLYSPVQWVQTVQYLVKQGVELIIECGPGKVLAGLNKRITPEVPTVHTDTLKQFTIALEEMSYVTER